MPQKRCFWGRFISLIIRWANHTDLALVQTIGAGTHIEMGSVIVKAQRETTVIVGGKLLKGTRLTGRTLVNDRILFCSLRINCL